MKEQHGSERDQEGSGELTLARLDELREQFATGQKLTRAVPLVRQERGRPLPLSFAQERLWFLNQLGLVSHAYNSQRALRLHGNLDVGALERSLTELIRRHESLRTRFQSTAGTPFQVIDPPSPCVLETRDISGLDEQEKALALERFSRQEAQGAFDLTKGSLLRASLLQLSRHEYVLILTTHHIVSDGWSWAVLSRELGTLYAAYYQGRQSPLPELSVQYADYAIWQREWMQGQVLQRELKYWSERLRGAPPELLLPTDRPRPAVRSFAGARVTFDVQLSVRRALERIAREENSTLFMVLLAAYHVLLARYSGQEDVVVGSPIAGRTHAQTEGLIGFFVNTIAFRMDLSGNPTFRRLLRQVKAVALGAYEHQDLPFEKLVTELRPERSLTRQPLFQVMLALQNYPHEQLELPGLTLSGIETQHVNAPVDLTLHLFEVPGGLRGVFVFATDLFDEATIERAAGHFIKLLEGIVGEADSPILQLPMLTAAERVQVMFGFNDTAAVYPRDRLIHELFEEQVKCSPNAIAVVYADSSFTYAELNARANQLARYLLSQGVAPGEYVPVLMSRSVLMLIAQIAVLKSGGVYVPIDPTLPLERRSFMIGDCSARRILADGNEVQDPRSGTGGWINVVAIADVLGRLPAADLCLSFDPVPPAYVMYTSGSTGIPKGVVVPHQAVSRLAINNGYAQINAEDCIAHYSNPAFDASTFEVWGAVLNGARIVIVPPPIVLDRRRFAEVLKDQRVTLLYMSVGLFNQYTDALADVFTDLQYLLVGGESLEPGAVRRVLKSSPPKHLVNVYGPTECTTFSTKYVIKTVDESAKQIPIGHPIANAQVYILDSSRQPVPIGFTGEIYIGGDGVACGYLNQRDLTSERFLTNPFTRDPPSRLYKTGDLGRWRADGVIEFLGRNDSQVKIRGFRIELAEIEAQLTRHDQIKAAAVLAREDVPGEKRLVAYVVPKDLSTPPPVGELRAHLKSALPEFMVPGAIVALDEMPLTSTGKVNRHALPVPAAGAYVYQEYEAPLGAVEEVIAGIWQELLGLDRLGRHDNFFELGGHSLLVLKALYKINQRLGADLNVADAYTSPTVNGLAARLSGSIHEDAVVSLSQEAVLDDNIVARSGLRNIPVGAVLLTGCTGFVGRFLLSQLLRHSGATIYCLVRSPSHQDAMSRVKKTMARWDLSCDGFESRVVAIAGDLRLPRLALDLLTYQSLCEKIDSIYHCATSMNHLESYTMAKPANVESARELLKLATDHKPKLINYFSTLSIFDSSSSDIPRVVDERTPIDLERHLASRGYAASKWVGEKIFINAGERGIPCNIFRLGLVWADTEKGRYDELQREYRVLKSCFLSGYGIQDYSYTMPPTPVDYVARAAVFLANRHHEGGGIFHLSAKSGAIGGVFERCNEIAHTALTLVPLYEWICVIKRLHDEKRSLPIVPLIESAFSLDRESFDEQHKRRTRSANNMRIDCTRTQTELESAGILTPEWNDEVLTVCVEDMLSRDAEVRELIRKGNRASRRVERV